MLTIRSVINPDKLAHLGPLADLRALRRQQREQPRSHTALATAPVPACLPDVGRTTVAPPMSHGCRLSRPYL